eukprot:CAMPEP_0180578520 /NCGR_PEP_ID=MMETSP1037_2-20121125/12506_1 /TAXON_ID=632150 /ORGANISM="Azadinium spinosum, Strain 3D9" /LENGTH=324 /DNA_ID=CAMNT_0022596329 /DNA_START=66 /DNA_END=1037 /DNA_ORIENTATION=+
MYSQFYLAAFCDAKGNGAMCHRYIITQQLAALFGRKYEGLQQHALSCIMDFVDVRVAQYPSAVQMRAQCRARRTRMSEQRLRSVFAHLKQYAETEWMNTASIQIHWLLGEDAPASGEEMCAQNDRLNAWSEDECQEVIEMLRAAGFYFYDCWSIEEMTVNWSQEPDIDPACFARCSVSFQHEAQHIVSELRWRTAISQERKIVQSMESIFQGIQETSYECEAYVHLNPSHRNTLALKGAVQAIASVQFNAALVRKSDPYAFLIQPICQRLQALGYELFMCYSSKYIGTWDECLLCIDWGGKRPYASRGALFHDEDWVVMSPHVW